MVAKKNPVTWIDADSFLTGAQAQEYDELPPHSEAARLLDLLVALGRECTRRGPHAHNIAEELRCVFGQPLSIEFPTALEICCISAVT